MGYRPVSLIEVWAWDRMVGAIAQDPDTGFYAFGYTEEWQTTGVELAPLQMPLSPAPYQFPQLSPETFHRLPAVFADALPDKFGNALVDAWMAENGIHRSEITPLDRLAYAGDRGMGALSFRPPAAHQKEQPAIIQIADLVLAARHTVRGDTSSDAARTDALQQLIQVGTSAGGARAKAVILFNKETAQIRSGHAAREPGFGDYLLKLDGVTTGATLDGRVDGLGASAPYGRIEYAYYLMATAAGIDMEPSELLFEGPRAHFLTKRFDRGAHGERHHLSTLCAMAHLDFNLAGAHSYDQYLHTISDLDLGWVALAQGFRRMVFNVAAVNRDDHTKNLGFLLPHGGQWRLAPAYDVTHSHRLDGGWTQRHQMRINGKIEGIGLADLREIGARHGIGNHQEVISDVLTTVESWPEFAAQAGVPPSDAAHIGEEIDRYKPR